MAKNASNPAPKKKSTAGAKWKAKFSDYQSKTRKKLKEMREAQVPEALMNTGLAMVASAPTGIVCGLVPNTYKVDMMGKSYEVPTRAITEGTITTLSLVGAVSSAVMGVRQGIYLFGGGFNTGSAMLLARGANWAREEAMKAWSNSQAQAPRPQASPGVAAGGM